MWSSGAGDLPQHGSDSGVEFCRQPIVSPAMPAVSKAVVRVGSGGRLLNGDTRHVTCSRRSGHSWQPIARLWPAGRLRCGSLSDPGGGCKLTARLLPPTRQRARLRRWMLSKAAGTGSEGGGRPPVSLAGFRARSPSVIGDLELRRPRIRWWDYALEMAEGRARAGFFAAAPAGRRRLPCARFRDLRWDAGVFCLWDHRAGSWSATCDAGER
jgi:hypothetical protein